MNEIQFQILLLSIPVIGFVVTTFLFKGVNALKDREQLARVIMLCEVAIKATEGAWKSLKGPDKKAKAIKYLRTLGIGMTDEQLGIFIDAIVEQLTAQGIINTHK